MDQQPTTVAEITVSYRPVISDKPVIISVLDAYFEFIKFFPQETIGLQERFMVMYLNKGNRCLGIFSASIGGMTSTVVDIRLILTVALKTAAIQMIICHNHPSGNLKPSTSDIELTGKLKAAASLLDLKLVDHLIISPNEGACYSFAEQMSI